MGNIERHAIYLGHLSTQKRPSDKGRRVRLSVLPGVW